MEMAMEMADVDTWTVDRCHSTLETWPSLSAATDRSLSGGISHIYRQQPTQPETDNGQQSTCPFLAYLRMGL